MVLDGGRLMKKVVPYCDKECETIFMDKTNFMDLKLIREQYMMDYHNKCECVMKDLYNEINNRMLYYLKNKESFYKGSQKRIEDKLINILSNTPFGLTPEVSDTFNCYIPRFATWRDFSAFGPYNIRKIENIYQLIEDYDKWLAGLRRKKESTVVILGG